MYQKNVKDCGVACLLTIIRYYKGDNTYENIRHLTKCGNNGLSALNLVEAGERLGFDTNGYRCNYFDLKNIVLPSIAHVVLNNGYNHYIVINKVTNDYVYVFDPAFGNKRYAKEEFCSIWDNIVIEFRKSRKLDVIKEDYSNLLKVVFDNKKLYIKSFIITFISIFLVILNNYYFKTLIDYNNITIVFILFTFVLILKEITDYIRNKILIKLEKSIDTSLHLNTHKNMLLLPYYYFDSRSDGDVITKFSDLDYIRELFIKVPMFVVVDVFLIIISTYILLNINKSLFLIFLLICMLYILILFICDKKTKKLLALNQELHSFNNSILIENVKGIHTIKNINIEDIRNERYKNSYNLLLDNRMNYEKLYNTMSLSKNIVLFLGINIILYIGMIYVNSNTMLLSDLVLFNSIILYFVEPLKDIYELNKTVKNGVNSLKRVNEFYCEKKIMNSVSNYDIKTNNLCFSYDGYNNIINNLNILIDMGDKVIVTGVSGSGKSTLFKLINKTYEVDNNMIYIGNNDINKIDVNSIMTYISQDEILFNDTLYNNIVLNNDTSNLDKVLNITKLNYVIKKRCLTLDSMIEENGSNLSMGEKQRIILARALLRNSKIIILDEALSGISETDEYDIIKNIIDTYKDTTIIYITHTKTCLNLFNKNIKIGGKNEEINK